MAEIPLHFAGLAALTSGSVEPTEGDCVMPAVIKIRHGRKKAHTAYSVPESVGKRIHTRLLNSR